MRIRPAISPDSEITGVSRLGLNLRRPPSLRGVVAAEVGPVPAAQ